MAVERIPRALWNGCSEREVLFGVFHELERPIHVIKGYGKLLSEAHLSEDERQKAARQIVDYIESLERLRDSLDEYLREFRNST